MNSDIEAAIACNADGVHLPERWMKNLTYITSLKTGTFNGLSRPVVGVSVHSEVGSHFGTVAVCLSSELHCEKGC